MDKKTKSTIDTSILFTILQTLIGIIFLPNITDSIQTLAPENGMSVFISVAIVPTILIISWIISFILIIVRKFKSNDNWLVPLLLSPIVVIIVTAIYYTIIFSLS
ncbi:MAG: hypothetical protein IJ094_07020 [Bacilli bacterium]|nr:hypothetical protein [Bacilli bacterium]